MQTCCHDATHTKQLHPVQQQQQQQVKHNPRISLQWSKCNLATVCVFGPTVFKDLAIKSQVCYNVQAMNA